YGKYDYNVHVADIRKVLKHLKIKDAVLGGFSMGGAIAIRVAAMDDEGIISKLALFGAATPIWAKRDDFPYNLTKSAVDDLIALNQKDQPKLLDQ
ncbi:MAG: alpha/beta hydrolase, partial [Cyclobacteriaceae bacterium]|nr:alpha/beta hydrolase [Cyclobacteriaceae bacterium]